jgi:predicted SAM-dependent methyltransferase
MDWRSEFFTQHFTKEELGLEIGPSHSPIASKKDGYNVKTVDHTDYHGLIKKYRDLGIDTKKIEEVDYVWDGKETLSELISGPHSFDYIIASHLIEHTTDLVTFLADCQKLLKPTGKLCLAIPDKRYCFDYFRFPSTTGELLEAHYQKYTRHTPGKVFDAVINASKRGEKTAWSDTDTGQLQLLHDIKHAKTKLKEAQESNEYVDIHNWMFTPASFRLLISDLQLLKLTRLSYVDHLPTQGFEFFAILSPKAPRINTPRIELAVAAMNDIKDMLGVDEAKLQQQIKALKDELKLVKQENTAMKQSKRWRYTDKPARILRKTRPRARR